MGLYKTPPLHNLIGPPLHHAAAGFDHFLSD